jgi:hypothetical protein
MAADAALSPERRRGGGGGTAARTQPATLKRIRELCHQRRLSSAGVHTHGDVKVDHRGRSARVLVDTCVSIDELAREVELEHSQQLLELTREVQRLRTALRDWDDVFGPARTNGASSTLGSTCNSGNQLAPSSASMARSFAAAETSPGAAERPRRSELRPGCAVTPRTLRDELQSLRTQVSDLRAENFELRRQRDTATTQLGMIAAAARWRPSDGVSPSPAN